MKKATTTIAAILSVLIFSAYVALPAYSQVNGVTTITESTANVTILGFNWELVTRRKDVVVFEQQLIQINVTVFENCTGVRRMVANCSTDLYPLDKLFQQQEPCVQTIPTALWDGLVFLLAPGGPSNYVKYDHDDNKYTYRPNETNVDYHLFGTSRVHQHTAEWRIENGKTAGTYEAVIGTILGAIIFLVGIPEPAITKFIAGVLGVLGAILVIAGASVYFFLNDVLQTEMRDGWSWAWDFGRFLCFYWWRQSFGAWRDWGWFFVWADTGGAPPIEDDGHGTFGGGGWIVPPKAWPL